MNEKIEMKMALVLLSVILVNVSDNQVITFISLMVALLYSASLAVHLWNLLEKGIEASKENNNG
jgi:hypothetical protein